MSATPPTAEVTRMRQHIRAERSQAAAHMGHVEPWLVGEALLALTGWAGAGLAGLAGWIPVWLRSSMDAASRRPRSR